MDGMKNTSLSTITLFIKNRNEDLSVTGKISEPDTDGSRLVTLDGGMRAKVEAYFEEWDVKARLFTHTPETPPPYTVSLLPNGNLKLSPKKP